MKLKWYGHSCFLLTSDAGTRILCDPCDPETGYKIPTLTVDAVTVSHDHHDHNYCAVAAGNPVRISTAEPVQVGDVHITGYACWHDDQHGALRGANMIYVYEVDGMRVAHLGDLGDIPDDDTIQRIGKLDVLLVPVGGRYTIDYRKAIDIANMLKPSVLVPMHYNTPSLTFELGDLSPLLAAAKDCSIHRLNESECTLSRDALGDDRIVVLDYRN